MKHIKKGKVLIISDIHQDIGGYVTPILDRETDWDYIIFNGDYFDTVRTPNGKIYDGAIW
jgi:predicted phosphodiesterase